MTNRSYDTQKARKLIDLFPFTAILGARQSGNKRCKLHEKITVLPLADVGNEWEYKS